MVFHICKVHIRSDKQTASTAFPQLPTGLREGGRDPKLANRFHLASLSKKYEFFGGIFREKIMRKIYFRWFQPQTKRKIPDVGK